MTVAFYPMMKMKTKKIIAKNPTNVLVQIQGESKADNIGKLGRGCGTHNQQCKRKFVFENIKVTGVKSTLCGINQNMETWRSSKMCRSVAVQQTCGSLYNRTSVRHFKVREAGDGKYCIISGTSSG
ncbi:hypothetical protein niasHS_000337 [Heterodera schachtii]|uniref:pectate lyase n=1 Tax=Heterodera schachtii TaxID=97005 RepID=A0ABD2KLZ3_HETSC